MAARSPVLLALAASIGGLCACAAGPDFKPPAAPSASGYGQASAGAQTASAEGPGGDAQRFVAGLDIPGQWWTLFGSAKLGRMVEEALKANPDVAAGEAALRQARELVAVQRAGYFPQVQASVGGARAKDPSLTLANPTVAPGSVYNLYTAQLAVGFTPDVFGANRRAVEAAQAQAEGARYQLEAVDLTLSSNVVATAIQEASLRAQIAATGRLLELQRQLTDVLRRRRTLGTASELDLLAQQAAEAQTAAALPPLQKQLGQTRDALTALLGRLPSEEPIETFTLDELTLPTELPLSLPSGLVADRPDVRLAEENLHAASAQLGVAVANLLPQVTISANTGSTALELSRMFGSYTGFWQLGASLSQTLFDGGALIHRRRAAEAALDQAAAQYRAAVILACQNVADSLRALQADADALKATENADRAAKATLDLAQRQLAIGTISQLAVLNAEQAYQQAEIAAIQARASRYSDTAALFQSLGGGWWNRVRE